MSDKLHSMHALSCGVNSCGHTTDFYVLGKTNLLWANLSKISRGKSISGFVLPTINKVKNSGKVTLLISAPKVFTPVEFFGA